MAVDNPLDKDKLPNLEVSQRNELLLCFFFDWFSVFVDAMSTLPVQDEVGCSTDSQRCVILIFFLVTALNAVIVSRFGLDINDLKSFVLLPNV